MRLGLLRSVTQKGQLPQGEGCVAATHAGARPGRSTFQTLEEHANVRLCAVHVAGQEVLADEFLSSLVARPTRPGVSSSYDA